MPGLDDGSDPYLAELIAAIERDPETVRLLLHGSRADALPPIEHAQGWPSGFLATALTRLVSDGDPILQQQLEQRVESLMDSRGIHHEWGNDLEPLKTLRFDHGDGRHVP